MTGCVTDVRRLSPKMVNSAMLSIAWQVARCELLHAQLASFPWTVGARQAVASSAVSIVYRLSSHSHAFSLFSAVWSPSSLF